jgi:hypothetical protein
LTNSNHFTPSLGALNRFERREYDDLNASQKDKIDSVPKREMIGRGSNHKHGMENNPSIAIHLCISHSLVSSVLPLTHTIFHSFVERIQSVETTDQFPIDF